MSSICGSDMHPYAGRGVVLDSGITFGHEYTGVIVAVGDEVRFSLAQSANASQHCHGNAKCDPDSCALKPAHCHITDVCLLLLARSAHSRLGTEWLQPFQLPVVSATTASTH